MGDGNDRDTDKARNGRHYNISSNNLHADSLETIHIADGVNAADKAEENNRNDQHLDQVHKCRAER